MRVCPATIRSYCFLHSLRSFAKTNLVKKRPKKSSNYAHGVGNYAPGILSAARRSLFRRSQPVLQSTHPTTICNVLQVFTENKGLYKNRLCYARYEKPLKNHSLEVAKNYVETYSSSNAAALYPEERVTKINLVTLLNYTENSMKGVMFYIEL